MKLILVITSLRNQVNFFKLNEASIQLGKKDTILVSGTVDRCTEARKILGDLGIEQSRVLLDIKSKGTRHFVKEYINDYKEMTFISENDIEERLIKAMYKGKLKIVRI